jgi:hypothetical protein
MNEGKFDVFLSYSSKDAPWVDEFVDTLQGSGVRPWSHHVDIMPGEKWAERIEGALRDSHTLVFILTSNSLDSRWTFFEIGAAIGGKKRIIPILADDTPAAQVPRMLAQFQFLRERSPSRAAERVAAVIKRAEADAAA